MGRDILLPLASSSGPRPPLPAGVGALPDSTCRRPQRSGTRRWQMQQAPDPGTRAPANTWGAPATHTRFRLFPGTPSRAVRGWAGPRLGRLPAAARHRVGRKVSAGREDRRCATGTRCVRPRDPHSRKRKTPAHVSAQVPLTSVTLLGLAHSHGPVREHSGWAEASGEAQPRRAPGTGRQPRAALPQAEAVCLCVRVHVHASACVCVCA